MKEAVAGARQHTVRLPAEYVAEHTHLAYASTAYGTQGATASAAHTVITDSMAAASLYVGMTRGRNANRLHLVAADLDDAREQFVLAMERDRADRGLDSAATAARESVRGLVPSAYQTRNPCPAPFEPDRRREQQAPDLRL
ncbi:hypothetical protein [Agromyces larvae]|uniref:Uncharacterized protein n=1 Tax=Agromyces larvae TaxID=2929802 RepID=A0ABY4BVE4_9MICO|nr:hypothetical protein [Agromyces larvae]UOE42719.1 hypothetical protein MTO99_11005 [Agromyces larvae]